MVKALRVLVAVTAAPHREKPCVMGTLAPCSAGPAKKRLAPQHYSIVTAGALGAKNSGTDANPLSSGLRPESRVNPE